MNLACRSVRRNKWNISGHHDLGSPFSGSAPCACWCLVHLLGDPWEGFRVYSASFPLLSLQELDDLRKSKLKIFRNIRVDEANILTWQGLIVPVSFGMRRGRGLSGIELRVTTAESVAGADVVCCKERKCVLAVVGKAIWGVGGGRLGADIGPVVCAYH